MDAYLWPSDLCHLITTIIRQRKKDIGDIEKYSQKNVRTVYSSFCLCVCVDCICILLCVVI